MESTSLPLLLVEDDRDLAANIEEYLARRGWEVDYAVNGARALDMLMQASYGIVILDHWLRDLPAWKSVSVCARASLRICRC